MKKFVLISAMMVAISAVGAWAAACADGAAGKYGALTIETVDGKCVATLDPKSTEDVNIPNDVVVDQFVYDRDFSVEQQPQTGISRGTGVLTLCLPFDGVIQKGGNLYEILRITKHDWGEIIWQIHTTQIESKQEFKAGKPYFLIPNNQDPVPVFVKSWNGGQITMNTSTLSPVIFGDNNEWEFRGTFNYKKWQDGDSQIGHVYGFAASDTTTASGEFKAGQFVRIKAGAFIKPMRAYLYYNKKPATSNAPIPANGNVLAKAAAEEEELPQTIEVIFQDKNGEVMSIAQMNTMTGEVTAVEGWYDLKGRKLNQKPTQKGTYFNNGKKVVIK